MAAGLHLAIRRAWQGIHAVVIERPVFRRRRAGGEDRLGCRGCGHRGRYRGQPECDSNVGCDGQHGVSRKTIPAGVNREFKRVYPVGWLGILAEVPPVEEELIYANHKSGFALASMRTPTCSHNYPVRHRCASGSLNRRTFLGRSRRCGPMLPNRCAGTACYWRAMPRISCRRQGRRAWRFCGPFPEIRGGPVA